MNRNIVVIDTGVDTSHSCFNGCAISKKLSVVKNMNGDNYEMSTECKDSIGHGTAVMGILTRECPKEVAFTIIKVFDKSEQTSIEMLVYALNYILRNISCDIINISLGTSIYDENLEKICKQIRDKGIIVISAYSNDGCISYPAAFDSVIGVDISSKCKNKRDYIYICNSPVNILGMGGNHRLAWKDSKYMIRQGASFTTAYVTAIILGFLIEKNNPKEIVSELKRNAIKVVDGETVKDSKKEIIWNMGRRIAVFPYNKEIHSIVNFSEMIDGNLVDVYDSKFFRNCGKTVRNFEGSNQYTIKNIDKIDWEKFDILVIGHIAEIEAAINEKIKRQLLEGCLFNHKDVFCFDDVGIEENDYENFSNAGLKLMIPNKNVSKYNKGGRLYLIGTPVVGIMGTSNQQCKFTLQLWLRKKLIEVGYDVGQLGTEPASVLFGMDGTIHFGYSGTVVKEGTFFVEYINEEIHKIDQKNKDIIIVGNQAGTVPRFAYNVNHLRLMELEFLLAANPDCVVLCVNIYDDLKFIFRSIQTIENIIDTKVIALAISPMVYKSDLYLMNEKKTLADDKEIKSFQTLLAEKFHIPAYPILQEDNVENILNCIIEYFGEENA
ncbi:MAG: S8 family serine peptidase [Anaeroplasmataceae bacterium]|nr:S8 family serine peptidase [Anaeroplasmataceae bacterium]